MNLDINDQLATIYTNLRMNLQLKRKLKGHSVFVSFFNLKSNDIYQLLKASAIKRKSLPKNTFEALLSRGFIRGAGEPDDYVITAKGIWEIESKKGAINPDILIDYIDSKFFDIFKQGGQLAEKEKIILLSMIAVRSFSDESALDLKKGESVLSCLQSLLESSFYLLLKTGIVINVKLEELFGAQGNEHPVSQLIRHTDLLPKRTWGIYRTLGKQKYYLDLLDGDKISEDRLIMLFGSIFGSAITDSIKTEVSIFCEKNAYDRSYVLFDVNTHRFANPIYDEQVNEAFEKYYASRYKWESKK